MPAWSCNSKRMDKFLKRAVAEESSQPPENAKRPRHNVEDITLSAEERFVLVSCFDEPERYVEVDLELLRPFNTRLYCVIRKDPPCTDSAGKCFWRTGMTRGLLLTLIRSLTVGMLTLSKNVAVGDALAMMDYENINLGGRIKPPTLGLAHPKRTETAQQTLQKTCEQVASVIVSWPRLEMCLDSSLIGAPCANSVTSTRAWIKFCHKPQPRSSAFWSEGSSFNASVARKFPKWAYSTLTAIGMLHSRLVRDNVLERDARGKEAYNTLEAAVESNMFGPFLATACDVSKSSGSASCRKEIARGEKFANEMRNIVIEGPLAKDKAAASFATAVFCLSEVIINVSPNLFNLFNGQCADENGKTLERTALKKALQQRGVAVVRWADDDKTPPGKPLLFPASWSQGVATNSPGPAMLIEFQSK